MNSSDPLADMCTRIRNAAKAKHATVDIPSSSIKEKIASILKNEGFISHYSIIRDNKQGILRVHLKYLEDKRSVIEGIRRVSKPSIRVYVKNRDIRPVRKGMGIAIISTPKGVMTNRDAKHQNLGGEVVCEVW